MTDEHHGGGDHARISVSARDGPRRRCEPGIDRGPIERHALCDGSDHATYHLPAECIERARQRVSDLYVAIGVRIVWAENVHPANASAHSPERDPSERLINILTPAMSRRLPVGQDALGAAAVTGRAGGQVAYVLFDRVGQVAVTSATNPADILGVVIAHELGHLLLPQGSHSRTGVMRPDLNFKTASLQQLMFTRAQADSIRGRLGRRAHPVLSGTETAGQ